MKYPFSFIIRGYNDGDDTYYEQCGMGICQSYTDAVNIIEQEFGDELMIIKHLELHESNELIFMPYEIMKRIVTEYFDGTETYEVQLSKDEAKEI